MASIAMKEAAPEPNFEAGEIDDTFILAAKNSSDFVDKKKMSLTSNERPTLATDEDFAALALPNDLPYDFMRDETSMNC